MQQRRAGHDLLLAVAEDSGGERRQGRILAG